MRRDWGLQRVIVIRLIGQPLIGLVLVILGVVAAHRGGVLSLEFCLDRSSERRCCLSVVQAGVGERRGGGGVGGVSLGGEGVVNLLRR